MSAIDTQPESLDDQSATLQSQSVWAAAGQQDLDFESQRLRNRLRAKMFGVDASPINIGRYTVLETVGTGGMGVVYAAYDAELDRRVAVKLLRTSPEDDASVGKGRLLREAQALAKLSHPNVVQVYEVGTFDGRVFLAMEFLAGPTLREWLAQEQRPWTEVLQHLCEAGRGLAAAHRQDVIHRDFKPANLLFGIDGRVRVVDFGLARGVGPAALRSVDLDDDDPTVSKGPAAFATELTQTGEVMGTPAYMSPEQARQERVDARSDQYSFCVALYEGLFGRRPHRGRSSAEVLSKVADGEIEPPPRNTKIPAKVVRAVMRGLETKPEDRFPTMEALLDELSLDRSARWRWAGGGALALAGAIALMPSQATCPSFADGLGEAWSPSRRAQVARAFEASGSAGAEHAAEVVGRRLDAYAAQWVDARQETCEAHHVEREQSSLLHDLRTACLHERQVELDALTQVLAHADAQIVEQAPHAVVGLSSIASCEDLERLRAQGPVDEARQELRISLARTRAHLDAGLWPQVVDEAEALAAQARDRGAPGEEAEAWYQAASALDLQHQRPAAVEAMQRVAELAEVSGRDELAARGWMALARLQARDGEHGSAEQSLRNAAAKVRRVGSDDDLELAVQEARAVVAWRAKQFDQAIATQRAVVAERRATLGDDDPRLADAVGVLGAILGEAGHTDEAIALHRESRQILERSYGPDHPMAARRVVNFATELWKRGELVAARRLLLEAEGRIEASLCSHSTALLKVHELLADIAATRGELGEARTRAEQMLALSSTEGATPGHRLDALALLTNIASTEGDHREAAARAREYLEALESSGAHDDYRVISLYTRVSLAEELAALGQLDEAGREARTALSALEQHDVGPFVALHVSAWGIVGQSAAAAGDRAEAARAYAAAIDRVAEGDPDDAELRLARARLQWALAQVLPAEQRAHAIELVAQAREVLAAQRPPPPELAALEAWSAPTVR